jgi:hypothetical protein
MSGQAYNEVIMKNTLKLLGIIALAVAIGLSVTACASKPIVFDKNLPKEQSVLIFFIPGIEITAYNGISIPIKEYRFANEKDATLSFKSTWRKVILPAGEIEFECSVQYAQPGHDGFWIYKGKDAFFKYLFEPGIGAEDRYFLFFTVFGGSDKNIWGINIFRGKPRMVGYPNEDRDNFVAFVPISKIE